MIDGSMKFLGSTTFEVSKPSLKGRIENYNENAGTFDVVVSDVNSPSGGSVRVPVWCKADQSDLKWYDAEKQSDGSYKVTVSIANHGYHTGTYTAYAYMIAANGTVTELVVGTCNVIEPKVDVSAKDSNGKETLYNLQVSNVGVLGGIRNVTFAVWSEEGGQDDLLWYYGSSAGTGKWTATADIRKHKTAGKYNVHVYGNMIDGSMKFLGSTTFNVSEAFIESNLEVKNYDTVTGTFEVDIPQPKCISGISKVLVPVWCDDAQSDIKWYDAKKKSDGNYYVQVDPANHNYNSGLYKIHIYIIANNGVENFIANTVQQVQATQYYTIMGSTTVTREQLVKYFKSKGKSYPAEQLSKGGASTLEEFCQIYIEEAEAEGVRAEVAFTQAMKETGWLQFGGSVKIEQYNFAGIGAVDNDPAGSSKWFPNVRTGIRAQIQHLKAYGSTSELNNECVDPRFNLVTRGCAPYVEWLGTKENPKGYGWATGKNYGPDIVKMIKELKIN